LKNFQPSKYDFLPFVPILAAVFFIVIANLVFIYFRLRLSYPVSLWEAGIITDAWRMLQGESIYATDIDHATHMYGPLTTIVLAQIFKITGPTLEAGRVVSAISGISAVLLVATIFGRSDRLTFVIAVALLLAANSRTGHYFTETRPDVDSVFFATAALIVLYQGQELKKKAPGVAFTALGSTLLVIAVMFKQTAIAFVFVPALAMLIQFQKASFRNQFLVAAAPIVSVLLAFASIWHFAPGLWHFMVEVPAQSNISVLRLGRMAVELLVSVPLLVLALMHWLFTDAQDGWRAPQARWLMAVMICAIPTSLAAFARAGGIEHPHSLIPALFAIGAFCAWRVPVASALLRDNSRSLPLRIFSGILFGLLLFAHAYPAPGVLGEALYGGNGVSDRALVIAEARSLPGKVISPDDPTIALFAKGYAGRAVGFEGDAVSWDSSRSQALVKEINSADYVIAWRRVLLLPGGKMLVTSMEWGTTDDVLQASGFTKSAFRTTSSPEYELWRRTRTPDLAPPLR
jgi:4-amino-4-deoxy-L-arabinose transferase-like glycosyltransferase